MSFSDMPKGIYQHVVNKKFYKVIGVGRLIENPEKLVVLYEQLYYSKLRNYNIALPKGTIWIRSTNDFVGKFNFVEPKSELFNVYEEWQQAEMIRFIKRNYE